MAPEEERVPFHRRFGLRLLQIMLIIFSLLLIKRCVNLYHDNRQVDQQVIKEYYEKGFDSGMKQASGLSRDPEPQFSNYAMKKAYLDGYRQGWDKGREADEQP